MKVWRARDEEAAFCKLFTTKPEKVYSHYYERICWTNHQPNGVAHLDMKEFLDVTFENSPVEYEISNI